MKQVALTVAATLRRRWFGGVLLLIAVAGALVGLPIAAGLGVGPSEYWAQAIPTFLAVIAGFPFALWLVRVEADVALEHAAIRGRARERQVVSLVRQELAEAAHDIESRRIRWPRPVAYPLVKITTWNALSDGGQLEAINNPRLISSFANAYFQIGTVTQLEIRWLSLEYWSVQGLARTRSHRLSDGETQDRLLETIATRDALAVEAVMSAINAADDYLATWPEPERPS